MTITVVKEKGVTVITMAEDRNSMLPPLCQIIKTVCYSPVCCSVKSGMIQSGVTAGLGTVLIMAGIFSIGLGPGRTSMHPEDFTHIGAAYWLGGVSLACGIVTVLAGRFPSMCLVIFAVIMNILGSVFTITGIVLYSIDLSEFSSRGYHEWFFKRMMIAVDVTMLILTILQLFVCVSLAVLGIRAVVRGMSEKQETRDAPELKESLLSSPQP